MQFAFTLEALKNCFPTKKGKRSYIDTVAYDKLEFLEVASKQLVLKLLLRMNGTSCLFLLLFLQVNEATYLQLSSACICLLRGLRLSFSRKVTRL